jgi:hypothetical protein
MPKNLAWTQQQVDSMLPSPAKLRQKINNYDIHKTQSLLQIIILNLKNINKYLALPRYWRRQDIGADKILVATKYWRRQNIRVDKIICVFKIIGVDKILASKTYTRQQNLGVNEKLAQTESWRRRRRISLL